jgi:hypothetical protein
VRLFVRLVDVVRDPDAKRTSVVIVPKTFCTPFVSMQRTTSRVYEEMDHDRRVESEIMSRNRKDGMGYRIGPSQPVRQAKENVKEREMKRGKPSAAMLYGYKSYPMMQARHLIRRTEGQHVYPGNFLKG